MTPTSSQKPLNLRLYAEPDSMPASKAARTAKLAIDEPDLLSDERAARLRCDLVAQEAPNEFSVGGRIQRHGVTEDGILYPTRAEDPDILARTCP